MTLSYLEIGVCESIHCFDKVQCEHKEGVDLALSLKKIPLTIK